MTRRRTRASSTGGTPQPVSPIPVKNSDQGPLLPKRRDAVAFPFGYVLSPTIPTLDSDEEPVQSRQSVINSSPITSSPQLSESLPFTLKDLLATSDSPTPTFSHSPLWTDTPIHVSPNHAATDKAKAATRVEQILKTLEDLQVKVAFRDPFADSSHGHVRAASGSSNVSPDTVL